MEESRKGMYPVPLAVLQKAGTAFIWPTKGGGEAVTVLEEHVQGGTSVILLHLSLYNPESYAEE